MRPIYYTDGTPSREYEDDDNPQSPTNNVPDGEAANVMMWALLAAYGENNNAEYVAQAALTALREHYNVMITRKQ